MDCRISSNGTKTISARRERGGRVAVGEREQETQDIGDADAEDGIERIEGQDARTLGNFRVGRTGPSQVRLMA